MTHLQKEKSRRQEGHMRKQDLQPTNGLGTSNHMILPLDWARFKPHDQLWIGTLDHYSQTVELKNS